MRLNWSPRTSSSSPVFTSMRSVRLPSPMRTAPAWSARIGRSRVRASIRLAPTESTMPRNRSTTVRFTEARSGSKASSSGCSTNTVQPSEGIGGVGGQHLLVAQVPGDGAFLRGLAGLRAAGQRGLHLVEPGEIRLLEHQADVRMRDEGALPVHHEGLSRLADLDLGDHVPDELEVHLRRGDPAGLATLRDGDDHVGLGLFPEVHRPPVDLPGLGLDEPRVGGEIGLAADRVHGQPGDAELLAAGRVDVADLGDGGHLALEAEEVEPALLERGPGGRALGLGHPAHLPLDLLDEALDLGGGRERLLALQGHERGLVLLVGEVELGDAAREQLGGHEQDEEGGVLPEQAAAPHHEPRTGLPRRERRWRGVPGVTLASVGGGVSPCQRTPVGASAARGRSGQPGSMAAFFFSMMSPA